jgi:hypothetical protein
METENGENPLITGSISARRRRTGKKVPMGRVAGIAAIAVGLAIGAGAVAGAAVTTSASGSSSTTAPKGPPPFQGTPPSAMGTVASVGADSFTLTTRDGTVVTVDVSNTTTYVDGGKASTLAGVTVGSHVAVVGPDTSNTVTASKVLVGLPPGPAGSGFKGAPPAGGKGSPPAGPEGASPAVGTGGASMAS